MCYLCHCVTILKTIMNFYRDKNMFLSYTLCLKCAGILGFLLEMANSFKEEQWISTGYHNDYNIFVYPV